MQLANWFIPHKDTHKKALLLSWDGLLIYVLIFILLQVSFSIIGYTKPGVLGISANINKTIVLLGGAIPANKEGSDALFNLGAAFTASQLLPQGVYVVMNGKIFNWENVIKDFSTGYFEEE